MMPPVDISCRAITPYAVFAMRADADATNILRALRDAAIIG